MKIGVFDSGLGGKITLVKCKTLLPEHEFIGYFDHEKAPYGDKHKSEIIELVD